MPQMTPDQTPATIRVDHPLAAIRRLPYAARKVAIVMLIAFFQCEIPSWLHILWKDWSEQTWDYFLRPGFKMGYKMQLVWQLKYASNDLCMVLVLYSICILAKQYSEILFFILFTFFLYSIIDAIMLWVDFKTSPSLYIALLIDMVLFMYGVIVGYKPKTISKVKSIF